MDQSLSRGMRQLAALGFGKAGLWAVVAILLALLLIGTGVWHARQSEEQRAERIAFQLADAVAQDVERHVEQLDLTLRRVMEGEQTPASQTLTQQQRNAVLFERTPRDRTIAFLDVLDTNGRALASSGPTDLPTSWAKQDYFEAHRNSRAEAVFVGQPFSTDHENSVGFTVSRRITAKDGTFAGVVVMGVRLAALRDLLSRYELAPGSAVMLLRSDGLVVLRLPFDVKDVGHPVDATSSFYAFVRDGHPSFIERDPVTGLQRQLVFHRVGTLPLIVSAAIPIADGYPSPVLGWLLAGAVVLGTVFVLLARGLWRERQRRIAAERQSHEKSRVLTTMSHELRTALHGILGYADQLSRDVGLGPAASRQIAEILHSSKHMREVINQLLDYARIEALGPALHMRRIDVRLVTEDCMAVVKPAAAARGLETGIIVAPGAPTQFVTDDIQLRQVLMNLLSNAVKYTPSGSVELRVLGDEEHLRIEVVDTGIGIPEMQRHLLFSEYERFGIERTGIQGTGLGLTIAHRLVRRMGGHIGHRDNPGGGSIFWLDLPASIADEPDCVSESAEPAPDHSLKVLVVDDSEINRAVAVAFLRTGGHAAMEARDGEEAVRLAAVHDFDVVLMDMRMAGLDGLEATQRIRALNNARGQVPIVAVTANALDQHAEECRCAGMSDHLAKPFTQFELLAAVARAARRSPAPSDAGVKSPPDCLAQLAACIGADEVQRLLDCLSLRIEALLRKLDDSAAFVSLDELAALAHELAGSAGTLGFTRLAAVAARFETDAVVEELRGEAKAALTELQRRRSLESMLSE